MKKLAAFALFLFLTTGLALADTPKEADAKAAKTAEPAKPKAAKETVKSDSRLAAEIEELRQAIQSQQEQLELLKGELAKRDRQIDEAREAAAAANARAAEANTKAAEAANSSAEVKTAAVTLPTPVSDLKASNEGLKTAVSAESAQTRGAGAETSPLQLHIGDASITPIGFADFTGVWRSRDGGSGIGTNFAGIPYGGSNVFQTNLNEFRFSMQNSRIGFRVDADVKGSHVLGYMEADFLGNNPGNVAVSSNSNTLRSRLYWVDLRKGAWEVLGGQTWTLATPNRSGVSPLPGDIFFSNNMDVNYQLGMVWGRIPEFRLAYHFPEDKAAFAVALDSPDQYMGGTNGSAATHFSSTGGGGFVNLDVGVAGGLRLLTHNFWSDGGGRYIFGQAPDVIARADGSLSPVHVGSTVDGFEFTHRNTILSGYYGLVYIPRNVAIDANGTTHIGWGFSGSPSTPSATSSGHNRSIQEGTFAFSQNFWKDPRYGGLTFIGQYSYLTRNPWSVATGQPKNAHASMVWVDLRYTLPGSAPTLGKP